MEPQAYLALAIAAAGLGLLPGIAVFAVIARTLSQGMRGTFLFISGIILGDMVFALLAMLGLALVAAEYPAIFQIIRITGAAYLFYLGAQSIRKAGGSRTQKQEFPEKGWHQITGGFLLTASNPKDLLFFVSFLPAFVDLENSSVLSLGLCTLIIAVVFFLTLSFYVLVAARASHFFKDHGHARILDYVSGMFLILIGVSVLVV